MAQEYRALTRLVAACAVALSLGGCPAPSTRPEAPSNSTAGPQGSNASPASPSMPQPPAPPRENRLSPATSSLVSQARALISRGDLDGASSTLDRALRIEPNNPLVWIELGRLRLAESDAHQAEGCGRKALALASGDRGTQAQAGRLLADALRAQRRNKEAIEIERQPFMR
jgi:tetratricopeptide (TPR) repeat protein